MKSHGGQFVLGVITAIAILVAAFYFGMVPGFSGSRIGPTLVVEAASPDGQYVARSERISNDQDWCEERITVDKLGDRSDWEREFVFINDCGMPVSIAWTGDRALRVGYGYNNLGKIHVYREAFSKDKQVAINYELANGGTQ